MMKRNNKGFTLIELLVTVTIIGILSAVAIPAYSDYVLRGKLAEAYSWLASTRVTLEQYYQDNRNYGSTAAVCGPAVPVNPAVKYFTYSCNWGVGGTNQFFTVTATGVPAQGAGGFTFTIDQANAKVTVAVPPGAGWATNATCWITKKGGLC